MDGEALKKFIGRYKGTADAVSSPLSRPENDEASPVSSKAAQPAPGEKGGPKKETYTGEKIAVKDLGGYSRAEAQAVYNYAGTFAAAAGLEAIPPLSSRPFPPNQRPKSRQRTRRSVGKGHTGKISLLWPIS